MPRKRVTLDTGVPDEKIDRIIFSSAGNPIISSAYGDTDYACGKCADIVISGDFPEIVVELADAKIWAACMKCGSHNLVPREIIPGLSG